MRLKIKVDNLIKNLFLIPLSQLWSLVYRIRRYLYQYGFLKRIEFRVPVITVGNLTFGGTGKTPLTLWIANLINNESKVPMILTRGYRGRLENHFGILRCGEKISGDPTEYGDEPVLLAKRIDRGTIVVGKNRASNFLYYFETEKPDVVILDDGFQHLKISGRLNIVIFDLSLPLSKYRTAPAGYMREGFTSLAEANIIIFNRVNPSTQYKIGHLKNKMKPYLSSEVEFIEIDYKSNGVVGMDETKALEKSSSTEFKCICISGIANPESFYVMAENAGGQIIKKISFPDHHNYNLEEINDFLKDARDENAIIVTTEKDIVKLRKIINSDLIYYLPIDLKFINGEKQLRETILQCLKTF